MSRGWQGLGAAGRDAFWQDLAGHGGIGLDTADLAWSDKMRSVLTGGLAGPTSQGKAWQVRRGRAGRDGVVQVRARQARLDVSGSDESMVGAWWYGMADMVRSVLRRSVQIGREMAVGARRVTLRPGEVR